MDFHPTLLEVAGIDGGEPLDGVSLMPLLRGEGRLERDAIFFHYPNYAFHRSNRLGSAIRAGRYKLIENFDDGSLELYDLENDLSETTDLAAKMPDRAGAMRQRLAAWRARTAAAMPTRSP
jgi:arylsulfatase A-like enzyme